jgi:murein L,D-transpeptidase YcbB/YkuD
VKRRKRSFLIAGMGATALVAGSPTLAQPAPLPTTIVPALPAVPADVESAYETYRIQPIWFRDGGVTAAVAQLTAILRRAPFDGFSDGPQLAAEVEAAAAAVRANPGSAAAADRVLSNAWVRYVQALKKPTTGMIYAYSVLKPHGRRTEDILLTAAAASSLGDYLSATSQLNPVYAAMRDTAWAEAQATGNLTPDPRLLANLDRARSIPARGRFVVVDAASSMLTLFDDGRPADSMKVITGTHDLPTPLIASMMYYVTYNPYWHAPDHLVRKTIAPTYLRQGMRYLKSHGYHVMDHWSASATEVDAATVDWKGAAAGTAHLLIRQDPGPLNSMGDLKFPFENPEGIYLHDTPNKELFGREVRNLSNGCVRLEDARRLGRWLLGEDPVAPSSDPETQVKLPTGIPIIATYLTAQVADGKIIYLPDIYGWDTQPPQFASAQ